MHPWTMLAITPIFATHQPSYILKWNEVKYTVWLVSTARFSVHTVLLILTAGFSVHMLLLHHYNSDLSHISDLYSLVIGMYKSEI